MHVSLPALGTAGDELRDVLQAIHARRAVRLLFERYHDRLGIPPRGCHPRDIVDQIAAASAFNGEEPRLTEKAVELAAKAYFLITARSQMERETLERES
jgi:hypothetical protein